jgi:predicted O-methyltransferase YrrM
MSTLGKNARPTEIDPVIALIEAARLRIIQDDRLVSDMPGNAGPFDGQSIAKAVLGSKNKENCQHLYNAAKQYGGGGVIELGTNLGISSAYLAAGAAKCPFGSASVITGDCSGKRIGMAKSVHQECGIFNIRYIEGFFDNTAEDIFGYMPNWTLAFIDGDHTYPGTIRYYEIAKNSSRSGCHVIFDDIGWSDPMKDVWEHIRRLHKDSAQVIGGMGFIVF